MSQFVVVDIESLSIDRWVAGLPLPSALVSSMNVTGYIVNGSNVTFVTSSCDEETEQFPIREDLSIDALIPFPTAGIYKLCLVSPGTTRMFLYDELTVNVLSMTVTSTNSTIYQFINNKKSVSLHVDVSAEDLVPIDVFVATSSSCTEKVDIVNSTVTIEKSGNVEFKFEHGYDDELTVCYTYANEVAMPVGTVLHLYSVHFDPATWRPFYGLAYHVTGVDIYTPYEESVRVIWISRNDTCDSIQGRDGDNLSSMEEVTFTQEGELVACVSFRKNNGVASYESVSYTDHHVVMYNKVSVSIEADRRLVANKQFVMTLVSSQYNLIDKVWWRNSAGETTEKRSLFDGKAPFVIPSAGEWWVVVQYVGEIPADYENDETMTRKVSTVTMLDVLYWIKGLNITTSEAIKTTNLEVRGEYLENGDLLALSPCDQPCESSDLAPFTYSVSGTATNVMTTESVRTDNLQEENCVCFRFGENNWMKYENLKLYIPKEDTVISKATKAYMLPSSSLYRRLDDNSVLTRVDVELMGHVQLLHNSNAFIVRTSEECSAETAVDKEISVETMMDQYGSAHVSMNYEIVGEPETTYKLCYKVGDRSVVTVPVEVAYKKISASNVTVLRGAPFTFTIDSDSIGFSDGDEAFWSLGTDCNSPITETASLSGGVFSWSGVSDFVMENGHLCLKFVDTSIFAPISNVLLEVVGTEDKSMDLVVDVTQPRVESLAIHGTVEWMQTVNYDGDHSEPLDTILCADGQCTFPVKEAYRSDSISRLGLMIKFHELPEPSFIPQVEITLRHHPVVLTTKMYHGKEHILELESSVFRESETITIMHDGQKVYSDLVLDHLYENKARATVVLSAGPGEYYVIYNYESVYCDDLIDVQIDTIDVILVNSVESTIVSEYQETTFRLDTSALIPSYESDRVLLCNMGCACETIYATGEIYSENQIGVVIPAYFTKLQLTTTPVYSQLAVCYRMGQSLPVDTGLVMTVLKINSFELSEVPEGVRIENVPIIGSGVGYGDKLLMVPDSSCAGIESIEATVVYTNKYVARLFEAPMLPATCQSATLNVFYVPTSTGEPIDLHQTITVMRVMMTASVESGYNLFGKVEMTFNVQGTTNLQEMIFFFKYADESDTTAYRCLTRPEKTNSTVPITCTFVSVPTSGVMRMMFRFVSVSNSESVWMDIDRPVTGGDVYIADFPAESRTGVQFEKVNPFYSKDLAAVDINFVNEKDVTVATYTSSINELEFIRPVEETEVKALATYGVFHGPLTGVTVHVCGLKAMNTTVPSILTTVETVFSLTMVYDDDDTLANITRVGFSTSTDCTTVLYANKADSTVAVTFEESYSRLYVCVDYGTGFGYSLLPYITVLEFRNAITVVAKEETRVNYQYLTVSPSESCELTQLTDITVNNGCDWVSSIFVGDAALVIDGKQSTSLVFGANIDYNPECNRPIDGKNQWMVFDFGTCYHVKGVEMYLLGIETDPRFVVLESSDVLSAEDEAWSLAATVEIVNTRAGWYSLGNFAVSGRYLRMRFVDSTSPFIIISEVRFTGVACNDASADIHVKWVKYGTGALDCSDPGYDYIIKDCTRTGIVNISEVGEYGLCRYDEDWSPVYNFNMTVVGIDAVSNAHNLPVGAVRTVTLSGFGIQDGDKITFVSESADCSSVASSSENVFTVTNQTAEMTFNAVPGMYKFCYQFLGMPFKSTLVESFSLVAPGSIELSTSELINRNLNTIVVTGNGVSENDMIAFTAGLCSEATPIPITRIHNEYGIQMMVFPETGMGIHVCYKYGGLEWMMLTTTVNIREVYSLDVDKLPLDLVAKLTLSGVGLTTEDKLCLMNSESVCSYCEQEIFAGRVFSVQGETTLFSMVHMTSQVTVRMCYKYASYQNFVAIGDVVMTVVPPALNSILPTRIVGNVANTISFTGDFMGGEILSGNVEAVLTTSDVNCYIDRVTLANGDVVFPLVALEDGYGATLSFVMEELPPLHICLRYPSRENFEMQSATLDVVMVHDMEPSYVPLNTYAIMFVSTYCSRPTDNVKFVPVDASCDAAYPEYLVGNQHIANVLFTDASIERYVLCYRPEGEIYTKLEAFAITVRDQRNIIDFASILEHFSVVGETETYEIEEDKIVDGDRMMWSLDGCVTAAPGTTEKMIENRTFTMAYSTVFMGASLCMKFVGTRNWAEYTNQKMSVLSVFNVQPRVFSRGVATSAD